MPEPLQGVEDRPPPGMREQVTDFAEFRLGELPGRQACAPRFPWAGALQDLRGSYTAVDLQHEISRLRGLSPEEVER